MPVEVYHYPIQGALVQCFITDGSVRPYRFVSIVGPMRVGQTRSGMLGIGVMVSAGPSDGGNGLVQSMGLAKVVADGEVWAGDPVCVGPEGGVLPILANRQSAGIAVENGLRGDLIQVWLNLSADFAPPLELLAATKLKNARREVGWNMKPGDATPETKVKRYVSRDG